MAREMVHDPRESKLPAWAQDTIDALRRRAEALEGQVSALMGTPGQSTTAFALVLGGDGFYTEVPLHSDSVRFKLVDGSEIDARVAVGSHVADGLYLNGRSHMLAVRPEASNALVIETRR